MPTSTVKREGALIVKLSLDELTRMLGLKSQRVAYAGDFDFIHSQIKLTVVGSGLPIPREGCYPDDGYLDIVQDASGKILECHVVTFDPKSKDIGG